MHSLENNNYTVEAAYYDQISYVGPICLKVFVDYLVIVIKNVLALSNLHCKR